MTRPNAIWALTPDERPPGGLIPTPEQPPAGVPESATTDVPPGLRGGLSLTDVVGTHVRLALLEFKEVCVSYASLNENVSAIVMRKPVADFILQLDALKAIALDLQRTIGRERR
jgi:hypothetical protein